MLRFAVATSPNAVSRVIWDAAYDIAAAAFSAEPNSAFSHAPRTVSPASSSMQARAGSAALVACEGPVASGPASNPRTVAAPAIATARRVITVSTPLGTDFSARTSVIRAMAPMDPAAAKISHIGKLGERQSWSSDVAQAQFMPGVPQRQQKKRSAQAQSQVRWDGRSNGGFDRCRTAHLPPLQETSSW